MPNLHQRAAEIQAKVCIIGECWIYPTEHRAYLTVEGKQVLVYRIIYEAVYGKVPEGLYVLHTCDNGNCVNPAHLEVGTQRKNMLDAVSRGRVQSKSNLAGVSWQASRERWLVMPRINGVKRVLYAGKDFFEACCVRKSWELTND